MLRLDEDGKVRAVISPGRIAVTLGYHLSRWTDQQRDRRGEQPFKDREEAGLHALLLSDRGIDHLSRDAA